MTSALIYLVVIALVAAVVYLLASAVFGRGEELAPLPPGASPTRLPAEGATGDDVRSVRFQQVIRGYKMSEVDWVLAKLSDEVDELRARVAELEGVDGDEPVDPRQARRERLQRRRAEQRGGAEPDSAGHDGGPDSPGQDSAGHDDADPDSAGHDSAGHDSAGHDPDHHNAGPGSTDAGTAAPQSVEPGHAEHDGPERHQNAGQHPDPAREPVRAAAGKTDKSAGTGSGGRHAQKPTSADG